MDKTCGNCGMFAREPIKQRSGACVGSFDRDTCTYHSTSIHRDESNCPWCSGWIPKQGPIEQSFEQLSEVAREMFLCISNPEKLIEQSKDKYVRDGHYRWTKVFREQLEELGVEL